jgi:CelD/BcsL family acetyltransferase involved in cellulose biosynthesis
VPSRSSPVPPRVLVLAPAEAGEALRPLPVAAGGAGGPDFEVVAGDVATLRARAGALLAEWDALRRRLGVASRFNDPEGFLRGVAGRHGVPCVLAVRDGDVLAVVVASLEHEPLVHKIGYVKVRTPRLRTLRVAETGILCDAAPAALDAVVATLRALVRSRAVDHLAIHNLPLDHPLAPRLAEVAAAGSGSVPVSRGRWRTRLLDPATGAKLVHHSGKTRHKLRKRASNLDAAFGGDVKLVRIERADQIDGFVRAATAIIRQTYQAALGIGVKDTPAYRQLLADLAATGNLGAYLLEAKGEAIAYLVGDVQDGTYRLWATSFLPQHWELGPGVVLLWRVLDELPARGVALFDFGFGEAEYKAMLGSERIEEGDWRIYARSLRGRAALLSDRVTGGVDAFGRRLLRSRNLVARVKKAWRERMKRGAGKGGDAAKTGGKKDVATKDAEP